MRDDDQQVEDAIFRSAMNPVPHPPYYPKAELKAAIGELLEALKFLRGVHLDKEKNYFLRQKLDQLIAKHEGKQG